MNFQNTLDLDDLWEINKFLISLIKRVNKGIKRKENKIL